MARNRTTDQQVIFLRENFHHFQAFHFHPVATHTAGHAHALEDARGGRRSTDRTGLAVVTVRTVRSGNTLEVVTLHDTGEALASAGARDVDLGAGALAQDVLEARVGVVGRAEAGEEQGDQDRQEAGREAEPRISALLAAIINKI